MLEKRINNNMKIIADDKIPYLKGVLEPFAEILYLPGASISNADLKNADALITRTITQCNENLLKNTSIKFIASATIGFDHIDTEWCQQHNIKWTNAPGCNATSVEQYIASALINLAKDKGFALKGKTLGIIGVGHVGSKVAELAEKLGMRILLNDPPKAEIEGNKKFVSIEQIKSESDIITIHVSLNKKDGKHKTHHLIDDDFFNSLIKKPYFINTSRGAVVKTNALKNALKMNKISGAILDVWENEPFIDIKLLDMVIYGTPHIAGYSTEGKANGTSMVVNALSNHFNLSLDKWYPEKLLVHDKMLISLNCKGLSDDDILYNIISKTYNIKDDDRKLRNSVKTFEKQRGDYPIRREFPAYTIELKKCPEQIKKILDYLTTV